MPAFTITNKAKTDLKNIAAYTQEKWGRQQRLIYLKQLDDTFHYLADSPVVGKKCDYLKAGYKKYAVTSHIIFYRSLNDENIEIIRTLHKRMGVKKTLFKP